MQLKTITCRDHGGTFMVEPKRGRPPVRCTTDNVCSMYGKASSQVSRVEQTASTIKNRRMRDVPPTSEGPYVAELRAGMLENSKPPNLQPKVVRAGKADRVIPAPESDSKPRSAPDDDVRLASEARERLQPLGWRCAATRHGAEVHFTAIRDTELLVLVWSGGKLVSQHYSLWDTEKPSTNDRPNRRLAFDPNETTDMELVRAIAGRKVIWWNRISGTEESAIVDRAKVTVEHVYRDGNELPDDRIIKFVDQVRSGSRVGEIISTGYRAFRVGALLAVK